MNKIELGTRIREAREALGLKQAYVAKRLGVSDVSVCSWEHGKNCPSGDMIVSLANLFGLTVEFLVNGNSVAYLKALDLFEDFEKLDEKDRTEITNLILFKKRWNEEHGR